MGMAKELRLSVTYFFPLVCSCWTAEMWFAPTNSFLVSDYASLRCYSRFEGFHFDKDFQFCLDGRILQGVGGKPHTKVPYEPFVYYNLTVNQPGVYTCRVGNENVTTEVFLPPDEPLPVVSKVGESVNVFCPKGPVTSQRKLEMTAVDAKRIKTVDSDIVVMRDIDEKDAFNIGLCHYNFPSDNVTVSTKIRFIVVKSSIGAASSDMFITFTCTAFSNLTGITITLTVDGKDPVYSIYKANYVSEEVNKNSTNVTCSIWYMGKEIWSEAISEKRNKTDQKGNSRLLWTPVVVGCVVLLGIIVIIVLTCKYWMGRNREQGTEDIPEHTNNTETMGLRDSSQENEFDNTDNANEENRLPLNDVY